MGSRSGRSPARKLGLIGALGVGLITSATLATLAWREAAPKQPSNGFDVLRLPNNIADGAHIADEHGFFAENRIRIERSGKQLHGPASIVSLVAGQNDAAGSISTAMIIARNNGAIEQALRAGDVDVISGSERTPPGSKLLAEGGVHFIPGVSDFDVLGIEQIGGWVMRDDFVREHPDVVRRFIASQRRWIPRASANGSRSSKNLGRSRPAQSRSKTYSLTRTIRMRPKHQSQRKQRWRANSSDGPFSPTPNIRLVIKTNPRYPRNTVS